LLAALKGLEELGKSHDYRLVLKEILLKNLHKIENLSQPTAFIGREKELAEMQRVLKKKFSK